MGEGRASSSLSFFAWLVDRPAGSTVTTCAQRPRPACPHQGRVRDTHRVRHGSIWRLRGPCKDTPCAEAAATVRCPCASRVLCMRSVSVVVCAPARVSRTAAAAAVAHRQAQPITEPREHAQHAAATWAPDCCAHIPPVPKLARGKTFVHVLGKVRSAAGCTSTTAALCRGLWCRPALRATQGARRGAAARLQGARICGRGGVLVGRHDLLYLRAAPPGQAAAYAPRALATWPSCVSARSRPGRGPACAGCPPLL